MTDPDRGYQAACGCGWTGLVWTEAEPAAREQAAHEAVCPERRT